MPVNSSAADVTARIARLLVYPVKSCAAVELREAVLIETGLEFDRAWMVVDEHGEFVSQREYPRMALIRPTLRHSDMVLRAPGMLALHISLNEVESPARVRVWDDEVGAYDMGAVAAQWFSDFLGARLRLVRFDPEHRRVSSRKWTGEDEGLNQFSDGFAVLVASEASLEGLNERLAAAGHAPVTMERFRPNIVLSGLEAHDEDRLDVLEVQTGAAEGGDQVGEGGGEGNEGEAGAGPVRLRAVKPCPRCPIPNIDPATAESSPEVGDMLQTYRSNDIVGGAVTFGMNAIVLSGVEQVLRVGQTVTAGWKFD
jgi:uncharacterized protein YcbX